MNDFQKCGLEVVGVSADSVERQKKFEEKETLKVRLLSDENFKVLEKYGLYGEKKMYGKTSVGIKRGTVLIGKNGKVIKIWPNIRAKGHADRVLKEVQAMDL